MDNVNIDKTVFYAHSMDIECFNFIQGILPHGNIILEFGSGRATKELGKLYKMYSVEDNPAWQGKYSDYTTYINCGIKKYDSEFTAPDIPQNVGWYNPDELFPQLPTRYDMILVDGPLGNGRVGRGGFYKFLDKFNTDVPMIFDDVQRDPELILMKKVSDAVDRPYTLNGSFGYIL